MPPRHRRTALRVRDGRVAKKNLWRLDPRDYRALPQSEIQLDRRRPREGSRHLITIKQLRAFIERLPNWDEVAIGLNAIVLDDGDDDDGCMGWCQQGVVAVCAWAHDLWWDLVEEPWIAEHQPILKRLDVTCQALTDDEASARFFEGLDVPAATRARWAARLLKHRHFEIPWTEPQARAFQLLHILPHELGHHHDRITSRQQRTAGRGEPYAEHYANQVLETLWPSYTDTD
jgi:hypothetical protein